MNGKERVNYFFKEKSLKGKDILFIFVFLGVSKIIFLRFLYFTIQAHSWPFYYIEGGRGGGDWGYLSM